MASWRILVVLLALGVLLLGMVGAAWAQDHGAGTVHHAAVVLPDDASGSAQAVSADDGCMGLACCMVFHCAPCALIGLTDALKDRFPAEETLVRVFGVDPGRSRSIAPPTAPPRSARFDCSLRT